MSYKLKPGESVRKPVLKRTQIVVYVPVLLICFALACLIWLYVVGLSRISSDALTSAQDSWAEEPAQEEPVGPESPESDTSTPAPSEVCAPGGSLWG